MRAAVESVWQRPEVMELVGRIALLGKADCLERNG